MTIGKNFTTKIAAAFVAFTLTSFFMCSCSESTPEKVNIVEPVSADTSAVDTSAVTDTTTNSKADTTAKANSDSTKNEPDSTTIETTHNIFGYANRGQFFIGSEIVLREVDSTLAQTGIVHRSVIADTLGTFIFPDVKLTQPYVHIEVVGKFNSVCYESYYNGGNFFGSIEAYADVRKGDTINLNVLTQMQAKRLPRYIDKGYSFDSAMSTLQSEISTLLMLDTLHTEFSKLNLVTEQSESYYLLGATILAEAYIYGESNFEKMLDHEVLADSVTGGLWQQAYDASTGKDCWKITENSRKFGYHFIITDAKKYLSQVWVAKYNLGECTDENKNEIKAAAFNSKDLLYCDSTKKWRDPSTCTELDKIILYSSVGDTIPGHLTKAPYCQDVYYYWGTFQGEYMWKTAGNVDVGLKLACVNGTRGLYGKSGKKCYYCDGSYWLDKEMTECDEHIVSAGNTNN
jgi:hypothetical protein